MAWFDDKSLSFTKGFVNKIPPSIIGIGGDIIRDAIGLNPKKGLTGKIRDINPDPYYEEAFSFQKMLTDVRRRGVARPHRYIVQLTRLPTKFAEMARTDFAFDQSMQFITSDRLAFFVRSCEQAAFPGLNIQTQEARHQSYLTKMPVLRNNNETSWTFRCDNEMLEKKFFDLWTSAVINKHTGDVSYKDDYTVEAQIIQFDEHGKATYGVVLTGFFPIQVNDLDLAASSSDYHRLNVTFAYDKALVMAYDNPNYSIEATAKAQGTGSLSTYDRVINEVFKQGKNIVLKKIAKNVPISNIPGIGSPRDIFGLF